jgi:hypothetical protein
MPARAGDRRAALSVASRRHDDALPIMSPLIRRALLAACAASLTACGALHNARMWFPNASGMDEVNARLYVEPAMSGPQREALQHQIELGRAQVEAFYGSVTTTPYFVACVTTQCAVRFGSYGEPATAFGDMAIRLSRSGRLTQLVAHEWSHAELFRRAGGWRHIGKIPRWFDEGVAVVVADEALHSPANWQEIARRGMPTPPLTELVSRSDWAAAVRKYGETRGDDPSNLRVVYSTAGHEVRTFLACAGSAGVGAVLDAVRAGEPFGAAYARVGRGCVYRALAHSSHSALRGASIADMCRPGRACDFRHAHVAMRPPARPTACDSRIRWIGRPRMRRCAPTVRTQRDPTSEPP